MDEASHTPGTALPGFSARLADAYRRIAGAIERWPIEWIALATILLGVAFRIAAPFWMDLRSDGNTYVAMGHAWAMHGAFLMPYGDVATWGPMPPGYSHHYPPAYPLYLGVVFKLFGAGLVQAKVAAVVISIVALAVVAWATHDLYGRRAALLATGLVALQPHLVWVTGAGFSENMVLAFFTMTMWAILKSLRDERYIVWAGLFAGLAYLSRASVGYFFVIAGIGGFLWRFAYHRWRLFTNRHYMAAIAVFGAIVALWAWRNVYLFGWPNWETSRYTTFVTGYAIRNPDLWREALVRKIPFFLGFLALYSLPFGPEIGRSLRGLRRESTSALWLSVILLWVIAWAMSAMFWTYEKSGMWWVDNHRYVVIGVVPLAWIVLREQKPSPTATLRWILLAAALGAITLAVFASPVKFADIRAAEAMDPFLRPGDEISVHGNTIKYAFYAYLSRPADVTVYEWGDASRSPQFVVSTKQGERYGPAYSLVGTYSQEYWNRGVMTANLWVRNDVATARGVPLASGR